MILIDSNLPIHLRSPHSNEASEQRLLEKFTSEHRTLAVFIFHENISTKF
jgi:hypothetical protein